MFYQRIFTFKITLTTTKQIEPKEDRQITITF